MSLLFFFLCSLIAAVASQCSQNDVLKLTADCAMEVASMDRFKGAPQTGQLDKHNLEQHRLACCVLDAQAKCYQKRAPSECSKQFVDIVSASRTAIERLYDNRPCPHDCPSSASGLLPTWTMAAVVILTFLYSLNKRS